MRIKSAIARITKGAEAESKAANFLKQKGLKLVERNYLCRGGEIDLIMQEGEYLVFVEVRHRKSQDYGGALESVDYRKQAKLRRAAESYLLEKSLNDQAARFDVVCVDGALTKPDFQWIRNAF